MVFIWGEWEYCYTIISSTQTLQINLNYSTFSIELTNSFSPSTCSCRCPLILVLSMSKRWEGCMRVSNRPTPHQLAHHQCTQWQELRTTALLRRPMKVRVQLVGGATISQGPPHRHPSSVTQLLVLHIQLALLTLTKAGPILLILKRLGHKTPMI